MRRAATEAFRLAIAGGATPEVAKAQARTAGQEAWIAFKRAAQVTSNRAPATTPDKSSLGGAVGREGSGMLAAPAVLILAPTRELCSQTADTAAQVSKLCTRLIAYIDYSGLVRVVDGDLNSITIFTYPASRTYFRIFLPPAAHPELTRALPDPITFGPARRELRAERLERRLLQLVQGLLCHDGPYLGRLDDGRHLVRAEPLYRGHAWPRRQDRLDAADAHQQEL